jgi:hypothetical protein
MSNKQQTAVDLFIEQLEVKGNAAENSSIKRINISIDASDYIDLKIQAKEMEKERIIDDWRDGFLNGRKSMQKLDFSNAEQYYNETYGGNK